jgi:hypothetical protein
MAQVKMRISEKKEHSKERGGWGRTSKRMRTREMKNLRELPAYIWEFAPKRYP